MYKRNARCKVCRQVRPGEYCPIINQSQCHLKQDLRTVKELDDKLAMGRR